MQRKKLPVVMEVLILGLLHITSVENFEMNIFFKQEEKQFLAVKRGSFAF